MHPAAALTKQTSLIQTGLNLVTLLNLTSYQLPPDYDVNKNYTFDYIVVGAGAAGCVVANRLTECPDVSVLLIEAGGDTPFESYFPGLPYTLQKSHVDWNYTSVSDDYAQQCQKNKVIKMTRGKTLGGTSVLNFMAYTRGNPHDYEIWAVAAKDDSWKWENIIKYFIKSEKQNNTRILKSPYGAYHGTDGYMGVSTFPDYNNKKYFKAFQEMGYPIVLDTNSITFLGYSDLQSTILNDIRQSTSYSFLTPIKNRCNLYVMKNTLATKIIFDVKKRAIGVEVMRNSKKLVMRANKEVIISAGAINTPQMLMLSGIGPADHLTSKGIKVLVNNTQVGQNLQDHVSTMITHKLRKSHTKLQAIDPRKSFSHMVGYKALNKSQKYPDYQFVNIPLEDANSLLRFCTTIYSFNDDICNNLYNGGKEGELLFTLFNLLNPSSRGEILLKSSNPLEYPLLYTNYYSDDADLERQIDSVMEFVRVVNTTVFKSMNAERIDPKPKMCEGYDKMSREYIKCYILCMVMTQYHYAGTAAMGTVVDKRLRVIGIKNLRVIDASIMPHITSANTYAPTIMVAEKGADMVKEDGGFICKTVKGNGF